MKPLQPLQPLNNKILGNITQNKSQKTQEIEDQQNDSQSPVKSKQEEQLTNLSQLMTTSQQHESQIQLPVIIYNIILLEPQFSGDMYTFENYKYFFNQLQTLNQLAPIIDLKSLTNYTYKFTNFLQLNNNIISADISKFIKQKQQTLLTKSVGSKIKQQNYVISDLTNMMVVNDEIQSKQEFEQQFIACDNSQYSEYVDLNVQYFKIQINQQQYFPFFSDSLLNTNQQYIKSQIHNQIKYIFNQKQYLQQNQAETVVFCILQKILFHHCVYKNNNQQYNVISNNKTEIRYTGNQQFYQLFKQIINQNDCYSNLFDLHESKCSQQAVTAQKKQYIIELDYDKIVFNELFIQIENSPLKIINNLINNVNIFGTPQNQNTSLNQLPIVFTEFITNFQIYLKSGLNSHFTFALLNKSDLQNLLNVNNQQESSQSSQNQFSFQNSEIDEMLNQLDCDYSIDNDCVELSFDMEYYIQQYSDKIKNELKTYFDQNKKQLNIEEISIVGDVKQSQQILDILLMVLVECGVDQVEIVQ